MCILYLFIYLCLSVSHWFYVSGELCVLENSVSTQSTWSKTQPPGLEWKQICAAALTSGWKRIDPRNGNLSSSIRDHGLE